MSAAVQDTVEGSTRREQPLARMENLSVRWGERPVLDRVNLEIAAGEQLVVVGPSGAGKSTILRLLAGLLLPSSGNLNPVSYTHLTLPTKA